MIVQVNIEKGVSQDTLFLCNQYDNESANIEINLPAVFVDSTYLYFLICKSPDASINQYSVPLLLRETDDLNFIVNSNLSSIIGNWQFALVIKDASGELVAVTKYWTGKVLSGIIEKDELQEQIEDSNLKLANESMLEAEALRVIVEDERKANELARIQAENIREMAENGRVIEENIRAMNETAREELRVHLENIEADLETKLDEATENALESSEHADRALGYANIATQQAVIAMEFSNDVTVLQKAPTLANMDDAIILQQPTLSLI